MIETLPNARPARRAGPRLAIPRVIHQTFERAEVPTGMARAAQSWADLNPGFAWQFHDHTARRAFIDTSFGGEVARAYGMLKNGAFQADLWRYCLLYRQGGVYADIDMVCLMDLDTLLTPDDTLVAAPDGYRPWALSNGFLCAAPGHPVIRGAIERATHEILCKRSKFNGWLITGPGNLGRAANHALARPPETPFEGGTCSGSLRLIERANATQQMRRHFHTGERPVLLTEYAGYRGDLGTAGQTHWSATVPKPGLARRILHAIRRRSAA
ncbi:MAG: glycosyltransferase [Pseudomonadota bacterium]